MYRLKFSKRFKKDFKKVRRNPRFDSEKLKYIFHSLIKGTELDRKYNNHKLAGDFKDYYECHLAPDILLIYRLIEEKKVINKVINIDRIGSHSKLFK
ncbi:MAG: type II toxin-antitoxin system mRNA interferase toxin, RelE/StbE family [Patescibacteria group bacterium]